MLLFYGYVRKYLCHKILIKGKQFFIYGGNAHPEVTEYLVELFVNNCGVLRVSVEEE